MLTYLWLVNGSLVGWCGSFVGRNRYAVNRSWVDRGWVGRGWVDRKTDLVKLDLLVVYLHVVGCCCVWIRRITDAFTLGKRHFIYLTVVRLIVYRQLIGLRDEQNWSTELNFRKVCRKVRGKVTIQHLFHSIPNFRYAITKKRWAPFYLKQIWPFDFEFSSSFTL